MDRPRSPARRNDRWPIAISSPFGPLVPGQSLEDALMRKNAAAARLWTLLYLAIVVTTPFAWTQQNPPRTEIYGGYNWENPGGKLLTTPGGVMTNIGGMGKGFNIQSTFD